MNVENTKLDLSGCSEDERKEIVKAYANACGAEFNHSEVFLAFYGYRYGFNRVSYYKNKLAFEGGRFIEVKPIKKEEWISINSLDELNVGDAVKHIATETAMDVKFIGHAVYCENSISNVILHPDFLSMYKKLSTTYTFEPVQDYALAMKCYEEYISTFNHFPVDRSEFYNMREAFKKNW